MSVYDVMAILAYYAVGVITFAWVYSRKDPEHWTELPLAFLVWAWAWPVLVAIGVASVFWRRQPR